MGLERCSRPSPAGVQHSDRGRAKLNDSCAAGVLHTELNRRNVEDSVYSPVNYVVRVKAVGGICDLGWLVKAFIVGGM